MRPFEEQQGVGKGTPPFIKYDNFRIGPKLKEQTKLKPQQSHQFAQNPPSSQEWFQVSMSTLKQKNVELLASIAYIE